MRIIAGIRRGHKLIEFEGDKIRPTTDRVKESIFNLIQPFLAGSRVLDLFSGSGALAFEAVSRGSMSAVCVDMDKNSIEIIQKNRQHLRFEQEVTIVCQSAEQYLKEADEPFDVILLDPPYNKGIIGPIINLIQTRKLLSENGIIMLESDSTDEHGDVDGLETYRQRRYGRTYVTIYKQGECS